MASRSAVCSIPVPAPLKFVSDYLLCKYPCKSMVKTCIDLQKCYFSQRFLNLNSPVFSQRVFPKIASISPRKGGYRAQVYVKGERDSQTFRTEREADAWAPAGTRTAYHCSKARWPAPLVAGNLCQVSRGSPLRLAMGRVPRYRR